MLQLLTVIVVLYAAVGIGMLCLPATRGLIFDDIKSLRRKHILYEVVTGEAQPGAVRFFIFVVVVTLMTVVFWPLVLTALLGARKERAAMLEALDSEELSESGARFEGMGGAGTLTCVQCGHQEEVTSFVHGYADNGERNCDEGRQCLRCGKFTMIYGQGEPIRSQERRCDCGGELSREHLLFCPSCRSTNLRYWMEYIT